MVIAALSFFGCTSTDFQSWEGRSSVVEGHGGTRKIVDGMDVWTHGDPPRRFQVLGIIEDDRPGGLIPMARLKHDIVAKARQSGGDAVILVSSASQLQATIPPQMRVRIATVDIPAVSARPRPCRSLDAARRLLLLSICRRSLTTKTLQ